MPAIPINLFLTSAAVATAAFFLAPAEQAVAASSQACAGGGFTLVLADGSTVGAGDSTIAASRVDEPFLVKGKYIEFTVVPESFGIRNYLFTGAPNPEDITANQRTPVWAEKTPDHRGLELTSDVTAEIGEDEIVLQRSGTGDLDMKIQAKDCAQGGIFQMEPERGDHTRTLFTHILTPNVFFFDNPNFRAKEGIALPFKNTTVVVRPRVNIANNVSRKFVARDSAQVANRVPEPDCVNLIPTRFSTLDEVDHCGGFRAGWWRAAAAWGS